jgi:hypothetical protein
MVNDSIRARVLADKMDDETRNDQTRGADATMAEVNVTKADVLRAIETERDWWRAVVDLAAANGPVTCDEPVTGYWTYREVIGHVNGWRRWTAARLEAAANGTGRPITPWPAEMADETEAGTDEINAWIAEQSQSKSLDETIGETFALLDQMRDAVSRIPDERLLTPGVYTDIDPDLANYPIGAVVAFSIMHVHEEHAPDLQAWLSQRIGQHAELPPTPSTLGFED